jgi:hypothetical protein
MITDLQNRLSMQADELRHWRNRASLEGEMRQQAEMKVRELERTIHTAEEYNQRLESNVQEWKLAAEQDKARAMTYRQALAKISVCLKDLTSELDI